MQHDRRDRFAGFTLDRGKTRTDDKVVTLTRQLLASLDDPFKSLINGPSSNGAQRDAAVVVDRRGNESSHTSDIRTRPNPNGLRLCLLILQCHVGHGCSFCLIGGALFVQGADRAWHICRA